MKVESPARHAHRLSTLTAPSPSHTLNDIKLSLFGNRNLQSKFSVKGKSRIEKASFFSKLHFLFGIGLIRSANSLKGRELTVEDLHDVGDDESSERLETLFTAKYMKLRGQGYQGAKLVGILLAKIFKRDVYFQMLWQFIYAVAKISSAYFLSQMLKYVQNPETTVKERYIQALGLFISFIMAVYAAHQFNFNLSYVFNKIKTGLMGMIFRKSTKLSHHAVHITSLGKIVNFNATDLNNFEKIHFIVSLMIAPLVLLCGWGLLYHFWGLNSLVGIAYLGLLWPLQYKNATFPFSLRKIRSKEVDDRIEGIIEGIQGIEILKYYNWDLNFIQKIKGIRSVELENLKKVNYIECISRAFVFSSHWIASFLIYVTCTLRGEELKAYLIFPTIYLMTSLRQVCVSQTFQGFVFIEDLKMASRKINNIMDLSEIESRVVANGTKKPGNCAEFENSSAFRVNSNLEHDVVTVNSTTQVTIENPTKIYQPVIENINLNVKRGDLVAIIGDSGSGKSSILLSFTNEFAKTSGEFRFQGGKYAYVAQETVFFPGPLRDCIVFGKHYDEKFFWEVLEACCLAEEVKALPNQEMTEIVEKGTNLSEGQRARVSLARAVYSNADVYLLDECLCNLSMKVAKSIFSNCIQGLLKDKTVIMATNLLNLAKYANQIVVMEKGTIITQGTYEELIENDDNLKFISALKKLPKYEPIAAAKRGSRRFASAFTEDVLAQFVKSEVESYDEQKEKLCSQSQLINADPDLGLYYQDEKLDEWNVTWRIYWKYLTTIFNWKVIIPVGLLFVGSESISWLFTLFIAKWRTGEWSRDTSYIVIGTITAVSLPLSLIKYLFYFNRTLNASQKLHNTMLTRLFQSPMKFFDRNPSGRIINRFTNDTGILDKFLIAGLLDVLEGFVSFWVTLAALWTRQLEVFISFFVLVGFCVLINKWSYKAIAQTRGLELATRSPMYSLFLIGVRGLGVIRGHGQMEDVIQIFYKKADDYSKANFAYMSCVRLMSFVMDYLIELVVIATFAVFLSFEDTPLSSGFFVNKLGNLPSTMQWILRDFIKLHLLMASAARVINYCQNSKSERGEVKKEESNLTKGKIEMNNVQMRYSEKSDLIVNNLRLNVDPGEKIAIFSHSKGGVTSLIGLLTRLYEFEKHSYINSYVKIDGTDIDKIPISSLRESITVIPQTPILFKETIRNNLDPWKQHTDGEIWNAIDFVGLREVIEVLDRKLDTKLSRGSHVFSLGQQQLLCIARSLLKKCLIFVQDEATSHLDFASEQDIQKRLLKKYEGATVLNITHRLLTISNYDKVLTVENGEMTEFGEPYLLLVNQVGDRKITKKEGCFALAVINLGQKAANEIFRNAMVTYYEKHNLVLPQDEDPIISNQFFEESSNCSSEDRQGKESQKFLTPQKLKMLNGKFTFENGGSPVKTKRKDGRRRSSKLEEGTLEEILRENRRKIVAPNLLPLNKN